MSRRQLCAMFLVACCAMLASGCASDGSSSVHGSVYYGVGWHDPYYYNHGMYDGVVVVPDPPSRPERPETGPRPTPLPSARPASRPSIPSAPRPSGGGRRR